MQCPQGASAPWGHFVLIDHLVVLLVPGLGHGRGVVQEDDIGDVHIAEGFHRIQIDIPGIDHDDVAVRKGTMALP